jgi:hypothetical protein
VTARLPGKALLAPLTFVAALLVLAAPAAADEVAEIRDPSVEAECYGNVSAPGLQRVEIRPLAQIIAFSTEPGHPSNSSAFT